MASSKRVRGSPTGLTPRKPHKVAKSKAPKRNVGRNLDRGKDQGTSWTPSEEASLVHYIVEQCVSDGLKKNNLTRFHFTVCILYAGGSCRARIVVVLAKKFNSPKDALAPMRENVPTGGDNQRSPYSPIAVEHLRSTTRSFLSSIAIVQEDSTMDTFHSLSSDDHLVVVSHMVSHIVSSKYIPEDFIELALKSMHKLTSEGRSNVIYGLCKGFGKCRPGYPNECYFPTSRMPMGLLEYMVNFFIAEYGNKVNLNCFSILSQEFTTTFHES